MRIWNSNELEFVACDCCNSRNLAMKFTRADGLRVVECAECGLAFLNPRPRSDLIRLIYGADYFTGISAERGDGGLRPRAAGVSCAVRPPRALELVYEVSRGVKGKDILEVGCASGDLVRALVAAGANAKGIELSDYAGELARRQGLDVTTGTIEEYATAHSNCADILIALEVIEHVLSPRRFLQDAFKLIRPHGVLIMSTPNYACSRRFREEWLGFNASFEHIYFFSPATLLRIAQSEGYALAHLESSKFLGGPRSPDSFIKHQCERIKTVRYFIAEAGLWRGLAAAISRWSDHFDCGVGHTLLMAFKRRGWTKCMTERRTIFDVMRCRADV